jgi:hypothetical protein
MVRSDDGDDEHGGLDFGGNVRLTPHRTNNDPPSCDFHMQPRLHLGNLKHFATTYHYALIYIVSGFFDYYIVTCHLVDSWIS